MAKKKRTRRKTTTRKKTTRRKTSGSRGSGALANATVDQIQREVSKRHQRLAKKRDALLADLEEVEAELDSIAAMTDQPSPKRGRRSGPSRTGPRRRPKNDKPLPEVLHQVLQGKTLSVGEAVEAVQKAGYKTSSNNFRTIVNQQLIADKNKKLFKKVARGQYTAK